MTGLSGSSQITRNKTAAESQSSQPVQIRYGIHRLEARVGGKTVGEIRNLLQQPLNLDPRVIALVNHRQVTDQTLLKAGDQLEFVRLAGVKGQEDSAKAPVRRTMPLPNGCLDGSRPGRSAHWGSARHRRDFPSP